MFRSCLVASVVAFLGAPATGLAWTNATVRDVRAEVVVDVHGAAQVTLDIGVQVRGGWLERLDLEGLDEGLTLQERDSAWLTTDEGVVVPAQAEAEGGAITLRFEKARAARRGLHRIAVRYGTLLASHAAATGSSRRQMTWVLPGWEHGLSRAEIVVRGPRGLTAVRDPSQAVELTQTVIDGQSVSRFVRVLVPRSTAWAVSVEAPRTWFAAESRSHVENTAEVAIPGSSLRTGVVLTAFTWLLGFLARAVFRRRAREHGGQVRPWIRARGLRCSLLGFVAAAAIWGAVHGVLVMLAGLLALTMCFVDRVEVVPMSWPLGRFAPVGKNARQLARRRLLLQRLGLTSGLDMATGMGAAAACALVVFAVFQAKSDLVLALGLLCTLPLWTASSRMRLPRSTDEQLSLLVRAAQRALVSSCGMRLVGFFVGEQHLVAPRIRMVPSARFSGLLRLDVAVDTRRYATPLVLMAVVRTDSVADRALVAALGAKERELSPRGNRVAYVTPVDELGAAVERLLATLAAYEQRSVERSEGQRAA